jgi:iron-sulfur cluster repair protein YtfE (RIC family)
MDFNSRIARQLHDEHVAVIELMNKLQNFTRGDQPDTSDSQVLNFLGDLKITIEGEVTNHFQFEEDDLFPILNSEGDGDMSDLLADDHKIILPLGIELVELIKVVKTSGFTAESWQKFKQFGSEFADRLIDHASKEEIGLVPLIDDLLVAGVDADLAVKYIDNR